MAYKNRPLTDIVNKMYIRLEYQDTNGYWRWYYKTIDITINTVSDLCSTESLVIKFDFIVPEDFPPAEIIDRVTNTRIYLYHTEEVNSSGYFIEIYTDMYEMIFGKKLNPGEHGTIIFSIPILQFYSYTS
jgi:hypothetical protein